MKTSTLRTLNINFRISHGVYFPKLQSQLIPIMLQPNHIRLQQQPKDSPTFLSSQDLFVSIADLQATYIVIKADFFSAVVGIRPRFKKVFSIQLVRDLTGCSAASIGGRSLLYRHVDLGC